MPRLRRYAQAQARARTRAGTALPEDHGEEAEEARAEGEEARAEGKAEPEEARVEREAEAEEARVDGEEVEETRDGEGRGERRRRRAPWNSSIASFLAAPLIFPAGPPSLAVRALALLLLLISIGIEPAGQQVDWI